MEEGMKVVTEEHTKEDIVETMEEGMKVVTEEHIKEDIVETMEVVTLEEVILLRHTPLRDLRTELLIIVDLIIKSAPSLNQHRLKIWKKMLSYSLICRSNEFAVSSFYFVWSI